MKLTEREKEIVEIFKSAGFSGKIFNSMEGCLDYLDSIQKPLHVKEPDDADRMHRV